MGRKSERRKRDISSKIDHLLPSLQDLDNVILWEGNDKTIKKAWDKVLRCWQALDAKYEKWFCETLKEG